MGGWFAFVRIRHPAGFKWMDGLAGFWNSPIGKHKFEAELATNCFDIVELLFNRIGTQHTRLVGYCEDKARKATIFRLRSLGTQIFSSTQLQPAEGDMRNVEASLRRRICVSIQVKYQSYNPPSYCLLLAGWMNVDRNSRIPELHASRLPQPGHWDL